MIELDIPKNSSAVGRSVLKLGLPSGVMIVLIHRDEKYITANGETEIMAGDHLLVMTDKESVAKTHECFQSIL